MSNTSDAKAHFDGILPGVEQTIAAGGGPVEVMDRVVALLYDQVDHYTWVGIYLMDGDALELGPFRGKPSPHTRIALDSGICGAAALHKETVIVPDVNADPRYLACSIETKSEIVVPIMDGESCLGEIDIDSDTPDAFGEADRVFLERVAAQLTPILRAG